MGYKKGDEVVCIVNTNKTLIKDKIYTINQTTHGGFVSLSGVYDNNRNYKYFNPDLHFKYLSDVRQHKINKLMWWGYQ